MKRARASCPLASSPESFFQPALSPPDTEYPDHFCDRKNSRSASTKTAI